MYPKLFGNKYLNMYGLLIGIGIIMCLLFVRYGCKKRKIPDKFEDFVEYNAFISIAIGVLSGMLFQSIYNYIANPSAGFKFSFEGITFIGGLIGGVVTFLAIYFFYGRKKFGAYLIRLLPIAACCILVAHAFGRLGCLCSGCCYGKVFEEPHFGAIRFPEMMSMIIGHEPDGDPIYLYGHYAYPTQLFESLFLFLLFGVCAFLTIKKKYKYTMNLYLIAYGIFRFFIEYVRADDRGELIKGVPISPSQFWSIIMVTIGIAFYFIMPYIIKKFNIKFDEPELVEEQLEEAKA